jgi:hypothetical protein
VPGRGRHRDAEADRGHQQQSDRLPRRQAVQPRGLPAAEAGKAIWCHIFA